MQLILTVLERTARTSDAFSRVTRIAPVIQAALERTARTSDAFR